MNVYIGRRDDYSAMRGPCPEGFHIPSKEWWEGVIQILTRTFGMEINGPTLGTYLKMPMAGSRSRFTSEVSGVGTSGDYWSCTPGSSSPLFGSEFGFETKTSTILPMREFGRAFGFSLRGFKDSPVVPTSSWTTLYDGGNGAGIFRSSAEGLISISGNGLTRCTMQDKNLGATTVYNQGDTLTNANCGKFYQWGNNYGFAHSGAVTTSTTQVDASGYGPKNYYSSSTFIMNNNDWSSVQNDDLRGYVTGIQAVGHPIKNAYIGEYGWHPGANTVAYRPLNSTTTVNDQSGNGLNLTNTNATFGTYNGVSCVKFSGNGVLRQSTLTTQYIGQTFTWNVWVTRGNGSAEMVIGTYNNSGTKRSIGLVLTSTYIDYAIGTGSAWVDTLYSTNTTSNQWYNIVITHNSSGNIKGYLNGQQVATGTATVGEGASNFGIGASVFKENEIYYSTGTASEVIIENKTRTAAEIAAYYNQTKSKYGIS